MKEFIRRPSLRFRGSRTIRYHTNYNQTGVQDADTIDFTLYVSNVGDRGADHHLIEILTPLNASYHHSTAGINDPGVRLVGDELYFVDPRPGEWLFPNGVPTIHILQVVIKKPLESVHFLWRMYDEFMKYPLNNYGSIDVVVNTDMADLQPDTTGPNDKV